MLTNIYHITYTPGLKEAEVFFWGCNLECKGCLCKREVWDFTIRETLSLHQDSRPIADARPPENFLQFEQVLNILSQLDIKQVTLSGMEPTLDPTFPLLTKALHDKLGSFNVVFTNLYEVPSFEDTDMVVFGLNTVNDSLHKDYTGQSNKKILDNFIGLHQSGKKVGIATPLIPGYIDNHEIEQIAKFIAGVNPAISYFIRPFFKAGDNSWRPPTHAEMDEAARIARKYLTNVNYLYGDEKLKFEVFTVFPDSAAISKLNEGR